MATLPILLASNETAKQVVDEIIAESTNLEGITDPQILYDLVTKLKDACDTYVQANKELVQYYLKAPSLAEARTVRKERFTLLHGDVKETIDVVNLQLGEMEQEKVTEIMSILLVLKHEQNY